MATLKELGKVREETEELTRCRISGPTAGRQLRIAAIGMPSPPLPSTRSADLQSVSDRAELRPEHTMRTNCAISDAFVRYYVIA